METTNLEEPKNLINEMENNEKNKGSLQKKKNGTSRRIEQRYMNQTRLAQWYTHMVANLSPALSERPNSYAQSYAQNGGLIIVCNRSGRRINYSL